MLASSPALDSRYRTHLRLIADNEADARYICQLRGDPSLNGFLNPSTNDVAAQLRWLHEYKRREAAGEEYYFCITSDGADHGLCRMYDFREIDGLRSFGWGSWIIPPPRPAGLVTYSALLIYQIGFDLLDFEQSHFDVRRENVGVIAFHERAGAIRIGETETDIFFRFPADQYRKFQSHSRSQISAHRVRT